MGQQSMTPGRPTGKVVLRPEASPAHANGASQRERADERASDDGMAARPAAEPAPMHEGISRAAYFRAEARGFAAGGELDDWLSSETELRRPPAP